MTNEMKERIEQINQSITGFERINSREEHEDDFVIKMELGTCDNETVYKQAAKEKLIEKMEYLVKEKGQAFITMELMQKLGMNPKTHFSGYKMKYDIKTMVFTVTEKK